MADEKITVAILDDSKFARKGMMADLGKHPDIQVLFDTSSAVSFWEKVQTLQPKVLILDLRIDGETTESLRIMKSAKTLVPAPACLVMTVMNDVQNFVNAVTSGADIFATKDDAAQQPEIDDLVRMAAQGKRFYPSDLVYNLIQALYQDGQKTLSLELTERERAILALVAERLSNDEIANRLTISENTVKNHVRNAMSKLNARDRFEAVEVARQRGLLSNPLNVQ